MKNKDNMENVFKKVLLYLREEGVSGFARRTINWIPQYIGWKKIMIRKWLYTRSAHFRFNDLKQKSKVDSYIKFKQIESGLAYCHNHGLFNKILNDGEQIEVVLPKYFEKRNETEKTIFDAPPIYLAVFKKTKVYGATNLISIGHVALSDMFCRDKGKNRYCIEGGSIIWHQAGGKYIGVAYKETDIVIEEAISCLGWACNNYYHFTFEILSRLVFVDEYEEFRSIPILVDSEALSVPQMRALIERINIWNHPIIPVEKYHRIHVDRLIYISRNMWVPPDFRPGTISQKDDFMISRSVADNIRKRVLPVQRNYENTIYKKIFLPRKKSGSQRLINMDEITEIFADNGFHIVYPGDLSFEEQVLLFNGADIVVGVGGAALTNIVYCHEKARIVEIAPETHPVYAFSAIANAVKADLTILGADIVCKTKYTSSDTFLLNKDKCLRFIRSLNE